MAERTEQPTPRRRQEMRQKGQVARSHEIAGAVSLLAGLIALRAFGPRMFEDIRQIAVASFSHPYRLEMTPAVLSQQMGLVLLTAGKILLPLAAVTATGAVAASLLQTGFVYSPTPLIPDFKRINPIQGAQRLFSLRGLSELVKALLKVGLLAGVAYSYLRSHLPALSELSASTGLVAAGMIGRMVWELMLRLALALAIIAIVDYLFQRRIFEQSNRMTKEEVKEEYRRSEGDPLIKSRVRRMQQQLARGRMMSRVKDATVVVTNPIHVAVALRYEPRESPAPLVVAKGQRRTAERIKERARSHQVPLVENAPLARALFDTVDVGAQIPAHLYQAVAEIIAFVYRITGRVRPSGAR